jgi:hypothetical protein
VCRFVGGFLLSACLLLALAEAFLRAFPPRDLELYLGEDSPAAGPFVADHDFGVRYRDWDSFVAENDARLKPHLPLDGGADDWPRWAFFGNSFVQSPGALADQAREHVADRRVFYLRRIELLQVRLAQIRLLLEHGLQPERLFVALMPVDTMRLGSHPLSATRVSRAGAITCVPGLPSGPLGQALGHSRLAVAGCVRLGLHRVNRDYDLYHLYDRLDEPLLGDLCHLFGSLARLTRDRGIPTTVLLLPDYPQLVRGFGFGFQDAMAPILRDLGFDVFDPRDAFLHRDDVVSLFQTDGHFNSAGNHVLIGELLRHLDGKPPEHVASKGSKP